MIGNDEPPAVGPTARRAAKARPDGIARRLSEAWKSAAAALTRRAPRLSQPRRRRREGQGEGFLAAARAVLRRALDLPAIDAAAMFLAETLDWLNLWNPDAAELDGDQPDPVPNHLFPHP